MPTDLNTALLVLVVGMTTVFVILSLVVLSGKFLIQMVNRFAPDVPVRSIKTSSLPPSPASPAISPPVMAAIIAAVEEVTGGQGKIDRIEKDP